MKEERLPDQLWWSMKCLRDMLKSDEKIVLLSSAKKLVDEITGGDAND